jgi:hypothetical protein
MSCARKDAAVAMSEFTLYNPAHKLPDHYRGWPISWRWFPTDIGRACCCYVGMAGGTWYKATAAIQHGGYMLEWSIEEIA